MSGDKVGDFKSMFKDLMPGDRQRKVREERKQREKRSQLTAKQRRRSAVRTAQVNFRCSPALRDQLNHMAKALDISVADILEDAIGRFAEAEGFNGERTT